MTRSSLFIADAVSLLLGVLILCFSGGDGDSPVEVVYLERQPLANAEVFFLEDVQPSSQKDQQPKRAHGRTDEAGRYELVSGAMRGSYRVIVRALVGEDKQAMVPGLGSTGIDIAQFEAASSVTRAQSLRLLLRCYVPYFDSLVITC
jgi:hypothetical protein